jgi:hypothetical protein
VVDSDVEAQMSGIGIGGSSDRPPSTEIVVRVGESPAAAEALGRAAEQSLQTGVPLRIVHAWQMTASPSGGASAAFWVASAADARARATRWVLETLGDSAATVRWTLDIVELPPGLIVPLDAHAADAALEFTSVPGGDA